MLQEDGFGETPFFHCLVVETSNNSASKDSSSIEHDSVERQVVGYALYYFGYSTWHGKMVFLEDVYLSPEHRGKAIKPVEGFWVFKDPPLQPLLQHWLV